MATSPSLTDDFGPQHFGRAHLRDRRRPRSLVELADRLVQHPGGSLPEKFPDPNALRRCDDLRGVRRQRRPRWWRRSRSPG